MWQKVISQINFKSNFLKIWSAVFILTGFILAANFLLFGHSAPSLQQVLLQTSNSNALPGSLLVMSVLALSLLGLSAAKGCEIYTRTKSSLADIVFVDDSALKLAAVHDNKETEELRKGIKELWETIEQLEQGKELLQVQNISLVEEIKNISEKTAALTKIEQMLRKSNISLGKECERLKAQNEELVLKMNYLELEAKARLVAPQEAKKNKAQAKPVIIKAVQKRLNKKTNKAKKSK